MMTRWIVVFAMLIGVGINAPVAAQDAAEMPAIETPTAMPVEPPSPVTELPPVDIAAAIPAAAPAPAPAPAPAAPVESMLNPVAAIPAADAFPTLPPSRPCARQDVDGLWRLNKVYEAPESTETASFKAQPHQYFLFQRDDTFRTYKSSWPQKSDSVIMRQLEIEKPEQLQQFVVADAGLVYFYRDGVAYDTQACFIVANQQAPFTVGQMLLMPPEGQASVRLVKVYDRSLGGRSAATPNTQKATKKNRKKRNKGKKGKGKKRNK